MKKSQIIEELTKDKEKFAEILQEAERRLIGAPEGNLRFTKHGKGYQFYHRTEAKNKRGIYIPISEKNKAIALMQKKYDKTIEVAAKQQLSSIDRFLRKYDPDILKKLYVSMADVRKQYVIPFEISDQEYVQNWLSRDYERKPFAKDAPEHFTSRGERVRSKSEVMIADALYQAGIPYRYECPLKIGTTLIHPDFVILRIEDREELYWEHLGMMDDPDYCHNAIQRIRLYENCGICPGLRLILSMETSRIPINHTVIRRLIQSYCI